MITRRRLLTLATSLPVLVFAGVSAAEDKADRKARKRKAQEEALQALQRGEILPLTQVLAIATREVPGKVIEVEYEHGPRYEIKVLTPQGHIREIRIDARSGAVLKIKDKD